MVCGEGATETEKSLWGKRGWDPEARFQCWASVGRQAEAPGTDAGRWLGSVVEEEASSPQKYLPYCVTTFCLLSVPH